MVLLYKSEIWVVIESILKVLEGVSYQRVVEEGYQCSLLAEALEAAWICPMKEYIWRRQDIIAQYIANRPIYDLCTGAEQMPKLSICVWWWDQDLNPEEEGDGTREGAERDVG